jgi:hypothetical protein
LLVNFYVVKPHILGQLAPYLVFRIPGGMVRRVERRKVGEKGESLITGEKGEKGKEVRTYFHSSSIDLPNVLILQKKRKLLTNTGN